MALKLLEVRSLWSAAFLILSAGSVAIAAGPAPKTAPKTAPAPAPTSAAATPFQTLTFPDKISVAQLQYFTFVDRKGVSTTIHNKINARGTIKLPTNSNVCIALTYDGLEHLESLAQISPALVSQLNAASLDLDDKQFAFFKRFSGIFRINLDSTMVTDKSVPILASFKGLNDLRLSKVDVTGAGFEALNGLPLAIVNLEGTSLKEGNLQKIKSLPQRLTSMNLTHTQVTDKDMAFLGTCSKLNSLDLSGDKKITDACTKDIIKLKMLETLFIPDTSITEKSLPALVKMPNLKKLVVRDSTFWILGHGKSPRPSLQISDAAVTSRTPVDVFAPLH